MESNTNRSIIFLLLIYLWMLIATPQYRFPIIGDLHLERIIIFFVVFLLFVKGRNEATHSPVSKLVITFYLLLLVSYLLSAYINVSNAQYWIENYWKIILLYFLVIAAIKNIEELQTAIIGIMVIYFVYQLHTWFDFLRGGSYVYQQGVKRIIGVWSGGGIGSANLFASMSLLSVPYGIYAFSFFKDKRLKLWSVFYITMCVASIIFSGTRGALVALFAYLLLIYSRKNKKLIISITILLLVLFNFLPVDLQYRYTDLIFSSNNASELSQADEIALMSGESRIEGFKDGWRLLLNRPLIGYGPGASPYARKEVRKTGGTSFEDVMSLQLHSLYGQIMGETGIIGSIIFFILIITINRQLNVAYIQTCSFPELNVYKTTITFIKSFLVIMLLYGMFSHSLYSFYWLLLSGLHVSFMCIFKKDYEILNRRVKIKEHYY